MTLAGADLAQVGAEFVTLFVALLDDVLKCREIARQPRCGQRREHGIHVSPALRVQGEPRFVGAMAHQYESVLEMRTWSAMSRSWHKRLTNPKVAF